MGKIKRSLFASFLNTNTPGSPTWSLVSEGVPAGEVSMNPEVNQETYIGDENATITVESYSPQMGIDATAIEGDAVFDWINAARVGRDVLDAAETEILNVWLYETPSLGFYSAERQGVSVQVNSFGGEGGASAKIGYSINYIGEPVLGGYDPSGPTFTPLAVDTILTTLSIGGEVLTPVFSVDRSWLWYSLDVLNAVSSIQMDSTLVGATITQRDDLLNTVGQGANAALSVGVNDLTVEVTVGSETVTYHIEVTRAA